VSRLTFPVVPEGLAVPVWIGLPGRATAQLVAAGQPVPAPVQARGLIDTGSDRTCVASALVHRFGLPPAMQTSTTAVSGQIPVNLYEVSLSITDPATAGAPMLVEPDLLVMELPVALKNVDVLVGLDVVLECRLLIDGPARSFTIDF
jgi:hypothetical protein